MKFIASLLLCALLTSGCVKTSTPEEIAIEQRKQDMPFVADKISPLKEWIEAYRAQNGRLPTKEEFTSWVSANREYKAVWFFPEKPYFAKTWGANGRDYCIAVWRGEDVMFWQSWDRNTFRRTTPD